MNQTYFKWYKFDVKVVIATWTYQSCIESTNESRIIVDSFIFKISLVFMSSEKKIRSSFRKITILLSKQINRFQTEQSKREEILLHGKLAHKLKINIPNNVAKVLENRIIGRKFEIYNGHKNY